MSPNVANPNPTFVNIPSFHHSEAVEAVDFIEDLLARLFKTVGGFRTAAVKVCVGMRDQLTSHCHRSYPSDWQPFHWFFHVLSVFPAKVAEPAGKLSEDVFCQMLRSYCKASSCEQVC